MVTSGAHLSEKDPSFLQPIEGSESCGLLGKGKKIPSLHPSSFLLSSSFGEGDSSCGPCNDHSTVSGSELLSSEHHHEMAEGQAATGCQGGRTEECVAQWRWDLPGLGSLGCVLWGGAAI